MTAHAEDAPDTLRDTLLADHRRIEGVLSRVLVALEAVDWERAVAQWSEFEQALTIHLDVEDRHLIPALFVSRPRDARSLLQEHRHVRNRARELARGIEKRAVRPETVRGFVDELSAHVRRETPVLYEWADAELERADREAVLRAVTPTAGPAAKQKERAARKSKP